MNVDPTQPPPILKTPRLRLRSFRGEDAQSVADLAGDRDIASTMRFIPHPYTYEHAVQWIESLPARWMKLEHVSFAVTLKSQKVPAGAGIKRSTVDADEPIIGCVGLNLNPVDRHAELGYWIGKPYWNRGYATEAGRVVVTFVFESLLWNRVYSQHMTRNPASGRVLRKLGMTHEGRLRQHRFKWGVFEDLDVFGINLAEFARIRAGDGGSWF